MMFELAAQIFAVEDFDIFEHAAASSGCSTVVCSAFDDNNRIDGDLLPYNCTCDITCNFTKDSKVTVKLPGSTWGKWDLHVHTPESLVQEYPGEKEAAWAVFLDDLEKLPPEFKVLGINDYLFVDGYERVLNERRRGRLSNIDLILPVVELRLDKFGGVVETGPDGQYLPSSWSKINVHIIFDELPPEFIRRQFLAGLDRRFSLVDRDRNNWGGLIDKENLIALGNAIIQSMPDHLRANMPSPMKTGFNNLNITYDGLMDALDNPMLKGKFLVAVGKGEWESMRWNDNNIADKKSVINNADLIFTASANPEAYAKSRAALKNAGVQSRLLDCSDAHRLSVTKHKDRIGNCFTWIKANPTFSGLQQAIEEFDDRVYVGDTPAKLRMVEQNKTKYIRSIRVAKKHGSSLAEPWFDSEIPLNPDLVAIIGNKGSGKSALSDIIALVGNTRHHLKFSFLKGTRFRSPKRKFASHFIGELSWLDGTVTDRCLDEDPEPSGVERVKYLPQSYLEDLCNELGDGGSETFDAELRKIIYSHVPEAERLGKASMDELLGFKVAEIEQARKSLRGEIGKVNIEIVEAERRSTTEFRSSLEELLAARKAELVALDEAKPKQVQDPNAAPEALEESKQAAERVRALEENRKRIEDEVVRLRDLKSAAVKRQAVAKRIVSALSNHRKEHASFLGELTLLLADLKVEVPLERLVSLTVNTAPLDTIALAAVAEVEAVDVSLASQDEGSLSHRGAEVAAMLTEEKGKLGEPQRLFVLYREEMEKWEKSKAAITGTADDPGTILQLVSEIESLKIIPDKLIKLRTERAAKAGEIHGQIQAMVDEFSRLYLPVQRFVNSEDQREMDLPLDFQVQIEETGFATQLLRRLNQRVRGTFMGVDESSQTLRTLLQTADFATCDEAVAFANSIDDMLRFDRRDGQNGKPSRLVDQLSRGTTATDMLDYIYSFEYLVPRYSLTYDGQEIGELSPGERGLLLLVFYLLVDEDDIPIVIDQPEENLDNQTIYKVLVKCIKRAKERRQVIMVTHNPNLAVVCDAEQIIYASCNKTTSRFDYMAGAIEHPDIRAKVVEILEGTEPAFRNRQCKYRLN